MYFTLLGKKIFLKDLFPGMEKQPDDQEQEETDPKNKTINAVIAIGLTVAAVALAVWLDKQDFVKYPEEGGPAV